MTTPDPEAYSLDINDPDDAELIEYFLGELPDRVDSLNTAVNNADIEELGRLSHQLKGAAPGFGFDKIGSVAGEIEGQIRAMGDTKKDIDSIRADVDGLVALCQSYISTNPFAS
tara:strand:+ start:137825 stop:138166 length:342 start_codon:yes stop_codon:yes gene_type:complete